MWQLRRKTCADKLYLTFFFGEKYYFQFEKKNCFWSDFKQQILPFQEYYCRFEYIIEV